MKELPTIQENEDGSIPVPSEYRHLRMPWQVVVRSKPDKFGMLSERRYYRHPSLGHKPYLPLDEIELDGVRFRIIPYAGDARLAGVGTLKLPSKRLSPE
jgi:hypothetical protein